MSSARGLPNNQFFGRVKWRWMVIREAKHGDEWGIWNAHTRAITQVSSLEYPEEVLAELLRPEPVSNIEAIEGVQIFVAEIDHQIVGFGSIRIQSSEIEVMIVDPDFMRQGIGQKLMERLETVAIDAGLERLIVGSSVYGQPFYRACGFADIGIRNRTGHRMGVEFQEHLMEKLL